MSVVRVAPSVQEDGGRMDRVHALAVAARSRTDVDIATARCALCEDTEESIQAALPAEGTPQLQRTLTEYDGRLYCFRCLKVLSTDVIAPAVARWVRSHAEPPTLASSSWGADFSQRVEEAEKVHRETNGRDDVMAGRLWQCVACADSNSAADTDCRACGAARQMIVCDTCGCDALSVEFCQADQHTAASPKRHDIWTCTAASSSSPSSSSSPEANCRRVQLGGDTCVACGVPRSWSCARCTMVNHCPANACSVCDTIRQDTQGQDGGSGGSEEALAARRRAEAAALSRSRLEKRVEQLLCTPQPTEDDGNCLFDALAYQLLRCRALAGVMRLVLVAHIIANPEPRYAALLGSDLPAYVDRMAVPRTWGDELIVVAASEAFEANVFVLTSLATRWMLRFRAPDGKAATAPTALLAFVNQTHYYSALPRGFPTNEVVVDLGDVLPAVPVAVTTASTRPVTATDRAATPRTTAAAAGKGVARNAAATPRSFVTTPRSSTRRTSAADALPRASAGPTSTGATPRTVGGFVPRSTAATTTLARRRVAGASITTPPNRAPFQTSTAVTLRARGLGQFLKTASPRVGLGATAHGFYAHPAKLSDVPPTEVRFVPVRCYFLQHVMTGELLGVVAPAAAAASSSATPPATTAAAAAAATAVPLSAVVCPSLAEGCRHPPAEEFLFVELADGSLALVRDGVPWHVCCGVSLQGGSCALVAVRHADGAKGGVAGGSTGRRWDRVRFDLRPMAPSSSCSSGSGAAPHLCIACRSWFDPNTNTHKAEGADGCVRCSHRSHGQCFPVAG